MRFLLLYCFGLWAASGVHAQEGRPVSSKISDCDGAFVILQPGTFDLQFSGRPGNYNDLEAYPSLANISEKNAIWCSFIAPFDGRLSLEASLAEGNLRMILFEPFGSDACGDIYSGNAEIKRIVSNTDDRKVGLGLEVTGNTLYPLELIKGTRIFFFFGTDSDLRTTLSLNLHYEAFSADAAEAGSRGRVIDKREDPLTPPLKILIRDAETGEPVIGDVLIEGANNISGLYRASDLYFTVERSGQIFVKCDVEGYFFLDRAEPVSVDTEHEMVIWLEPLGQGKSFQLEEIQFQPGKSDFTAGAETKLRRLKEFLVLNENVRIEIQGHVFARGENTPAARKLSEARAKQVFKFLVENGIDKNRMTTVGLGNSQPIYPDPRFSYEEQANRRVEIRVL